MPLLVIIVLAAALRFYGLGHQGIWYDESYTVQLLHLSLGRMLGQIPQQETTPPLYYCCAWVWTRVFGLSAAGIRSFSALCGVLTVPAMYAAARKLLEGRRAPLIAAALVAFNPLLIWYSQEARSYALLVLMVTCSLLAFAYARERPRPLALALWAVAAGLSLATHYFAVFVIAPEAAWLLYEHRHRKLAWLALVFVGAVGAALIPTALYQNSGTGALWIGRAPFGERLDQVVPLFLIGPEAPVRTLLKFTALIVVLAATALLIWRSRRRERQGALLVAGFGVAGFLLSILSIAFTDDFITRNILELWVPLALVVAAGLGVARAQPLGLVLAGVLCLTGLVAVFGVDADYYRQRPNWQPVAQLFGSHNGPRLIVVQGNPEGEPLSVFLPGLVYMPPEGANGVNQVDIVAVRKIPGLGHFCWWGSACNLAPSPVQKHYRIPGFHEVLRRRVEQFWVVKLVSDRPATVTLPSIARALRTTRLSTDALLIQP